MNISFLIKGFPSGFIDDFIMCIKEYYNNNIIFTFIASDFEQHLKTDKYIDIFLKMFKNKGIEFNKSYIINNRITSKDAIEFINKSQRLFGFQE